MGAMTDISMLPAPVRAYLTAHRAGDDEGVARLFAADGTATDEGETYTGPDEILAWRRSVSSAYTYTTEVTGVDKDGEAWVVAIRLEGDFPGGVADLHQRFLVRGDELTELRIS